MWGWLQTIWDAGTDYEHYLESRQDHYEAGVNERDVHAMDYELRQHGWQGGPEGWRGDPAADTAVTQRQNAEIVGAAGRPGGPMAAHRLG